VVASSSSMLATYSRRKSRAAWCFIKHVIIDQDQHRLQLPKAYFMQRPAAKG